MEVSIDDLLVKSMQEDDHLQHLSEAFEVLKKFQMKLNPTKCKFRVASGKFLRHMVTRRGIKVNPKRIQEIVNIQSPWSTKEVQTLAGRVVVLNRFIS